MTYNTVTLCEKHASSGFLPCLLPTFARLRARLPVAPATSLPCPMAFTPDDIRRLARLSRLGLDSGTAGMADDAERFARELSGIFGLIDQLQAVDTHGVEPLSHPLDTVQESAQRLREDAATAGNARDVNMANAPEAEHGLFLVPKVIE